MKNNRPCRREGAHDQHTGSLARHANQRRLTHRGPGPAHRGRQANHRLVFEEEQSALLLGPALDAGPFGGEPLGARFGILFQRTAFRFLATELEFFELPPERGDGHRQI